MATWERFGKRHSRMRSMPNWQRWKRERNRQDSWRNTRRIRNTSMLCRNKFLNGNVEQWPILTNLRRRHLKVSLVVWQAKSGRRLPLLRQLKSLWRVNSTKIYRKCEQRWKNSRTILKKKWITHKTLCSERLAQWRISLFQRVIVLELFVRCRLMTLNSIS